MLIFVPIGLNSKFYESGRRAGIQGGQLSQTQKEKEKEK